MSKITEINIQYAHERELLLKQLNLSEQMDIMDEFLEGEE